MAADGVMLLLGGGLLALLLALMLVELRRLGRAGAQPLARLESRVDTLAQQLGARMGESAAAAGQLTGLVQARLTEANQSMNALVDRLGRLDEATRNVQRVGESIIGLEQLLASPKLRGSFGEWSLESLLADVLPASSIITQHRLRSRGTIVDFAVRTGDGRIVPIDSKFPIESYRRLLDAQMIGEVSLEPMRREMHRTLRARVDEIAQRYICPDDGTLDFALMYVPSEGVYYEVAVRDEGQELLDYARDRRVLLCSPNTLYAYLQSIMAGLRGVEIARHAREIHATLEHLRQDVVSARAHFERAAAQLRHASQNVDVGMSALERMGDRVSEALSVDGSPALSASSARLPIPESAVSALHT